MPLVLVLVVIMMMMVSAVKESLINQLLFFHVFAFLQGFHFLQCLAHLHIVDSILTDSWKRLSLT